MTGANVVTTENSDWATNCPEYKVTAVQVGLAHPLGHGDGTPRRAQGEGSVRTGDETPRPAADDVLTVVD